MGDFTLHHKDKISDSTLKAVSTILSHQGSKNPLSVQHDSYVIHFYPKQISPLCNFITTEHGDFCGSSGTFIYKNMMGEDALRALLNDFRTDHYPADDFMGIFTVIMKKHNRLFLLTDPLGGNRVYHNQDNSFWSSSFLAAAQSAPRLTPNAQAIYEYAFQETTYGQDTVFREISCLDSLKIFEFTADGLKAYGKKLALQMPPSGQPREKLLDDTVNLLRGSVKPLSRIFGHKIRTALSGGYDSRLMLALLKDSGSTPEVYVYGPDHSPDVTVARTIAGAENFPLNHINKGNYPEPSPDQYQDIIEDNFYALDGLPGEGIFDFGANMATRRQRSDQNYMTFNGGGGEIFRNFFYLPDGDFSINDVMNCFYSRYSRSICSDKFTENHYRESLHDKIKTALGVSGDRLSRTEVEFVYPAFRLRYWTCRDNNNNTRLGSYLTPFISYAMIRQALTIPLAMKNHGGFQADLIRIISPKLASYDSDYGYAFDQPVPPMVKFKNNLTYYRPLLVRRYSYALQHRMRKLHLPRCLEADMLASVIDRDMPFMSSYFKIDQIKDSALLGRIYTLEYLFRHFGV